MLQWNAFVSIKKATYIKSHIKILSQKKKKNYNKIELISSYNIPAAVGHKYFVDVNVSR